MKTKKRKKKKPLALALTRGKSDTSLEVMTRIRAGIACGDNATKIRRDLQKVGIKISHTSIMNQMDEAFDDEEFVKWAQKWRTRQAFKMAQAVDLATDDVIGGLKQRIRLKEHDPAGSAKIAGILVDKGQLLAGQATSRDEAKSFAAKSLDDINSEIKALRREIRSTKKISKLDDDEVIDAEFEEVA